MPLAEAKVVLVTGGARGIGLGIAAWLLVEGWQVVIADRDRRRGAIVAEALGDNAWFVQLDVASEQTVVTVVAEVLAQFGRLDALINNAGISEPVSGPLDQLPIERWNEVLGAGVTGAMLLAKHCLPYLRQQGGCIVNIVSTRAHQSEPHTEAYAASKGGLLAFTHALSVSEGPVVRVNAVSPGWIDSRDPGERRRHPLSAGDHRQHPSGRVGRVEDIAATVGWLLSEVAGFVTGQEFLIDGGMTRKMIYAD